MNINAKVAEDKRKHLERFCPVPRCLWRTGGRYCPRHQPIKTNLTFEEARQIVREQKAGRAGVSWTDTPLTKSTLCVAVEMATETVIHPTRQSKGPALKEPNPITTAMEWIRNGFRFPGEG